MIKKAPPSWGGAYNELYNSTFLSTIVVEIKLLTRAFQSTTLSGLTVQR